MVSKIVFDEQRSDSMRGRICMVTGANAGIGRATAMSLAKLGATVVMVCRNADKGQAAWADIREASGDSNLELLIADLASQRAVRQLADEYRRSHDRLHVLVNNAGTSSKQRILTGDGIEQTFAVNHLAPFLLTNLLLDVLKASAPARVVNVTSSAESFGKIHFDDLTLAQNYGSMRAHAQSKLANVLFTYELARRLAGTGVTVNCLNPGAVRTDGPLQMGGFYGLMARLARPFALTPEQGAEAVVYLATSNEVEGVSGQYFEKQKAHQSSKQSYDAVLAQRLWDVSVELTKRERTGVGVSASR